MAVSIRFTGARNTTASPKVYVQVKRNGDYRSDGRDVHFQTDWKFEEFLSAASKALDMFPPAQRVFNEFGTEISDVLMFGGDNVVVYLTPDKNERFIPPFSNDDSSDKEGLPAQIGVFKVGAVFQEGTMSSRMTVASNETTGEQVIIKFIPRSALKDFGNVNKVEEEVRCLTLLSHPNIVKFQRREDLASHIVLVFDPWQGENLRQYLDARSPNNVAINAAVPESEAQTVIMQVASALIHLHLQGVVHGKISLENIVLKDSRELGHVFITGFDEASTRAPGETFHASLSGDVMYKGPEAFGRAQVRGPPMDVWTLGVVYYAMLHGRFPFFGRNLAEGVSSLKSIAFNIKTAGYTVNPQLSPACRFAVYRLFTIDPVNRPDISQASRLFEGTESIPREFSEDPLSHPTHATNPFDEKLPAVQGGRSTSFMQMRQNGSRQGSLHGSLHGPDSPRSLGGSFHGSPSESTSSKTAQRSASMGASFPVVGGGASFPAIGGGVGDTNGAAGNGGLMGMFSGMFRSSVSNKEGSTIRDPNLPDKSKEGISMRLVNSTRVKIDDHVQRLSLLVHSTLDKADFATSEARRASRSFSEKEKVPHQPRPLSGRVVGISSSATPTESVLHASGTISNSGSSNNIYLESFTKDELDISVHRPKAIFKSRELGTLGNSGRSAGSTGSHVSLAGLVDEVGDGSDGGCDKLRSTGGDMVITDTANTANTVATDVGPSVAAPSVAAPSAPSAPSAPVDSPGRNAHSSKAALAASEKSRTVSISSEEPVMMGDDEDDEYQYETSFGFGGKPQAPKKKGAGTGTGTGAGVVVARQASMKRT